MYVFLVNFFVDLTGVFRFLLVDLDSIFFFDFDR